MNMLACGLETRRLYHKLIALMLTTYCISQKDCYLVDGCCLGRICMLAQISLIPPQMCQVPANYRRPAPDLQLMTNDNMQLVRD